MITKENFPIVPEQIINALSELIPNKCPDLLDSDREVWYNAGRRSVVELLIEIYRIQTDPKE